MNEKKGAKQVRSEDKKETARNKERKRCENLGREKKSHQKTETYRVPVQTQMTRQEV